ncbi:MAG: concentrative nucleoside transporter CNT [Rhodospirillaceae bacterium]|nr:MAG: concentrative nucleoside transporter CNT [Rhodospirillaceae bacterium]
MVAQSAVGIAGLVAIAWALSEQRRRVSWRIIAAGLIVQFLLALLLLKFPPSQALFLGLTRLVDAVQAATIAGTSFVFGYVGGGRSPFAVTDPGAGFVLAFQALPLVLLMSVRGCWNAAWAWAARWGCRRRPTPSSAWSRRPC